jgi:hypothetical protein
MARVTTMYYTLVVERHGRSGAENERLIQRFVDSLEGGNPGDGRMDVSIEGHQYETVQELAD